MAYTGTSVVDYLKSIGKDSSFSARKNLAGQYGITGYTGTADQNTKLLNSLRNGGSVSNTSNNASNASNNASNALKSVSNASNNASNALNNISYNNTSALPGVSKETANKLGYYESGYKQSDAVTSAYKYLQSVQNNKPKAFTSNYKSQLDSIYNQIMNREKFSYDLDSDPLYNQYKEQYTNLGNTAMKDTVGQAAALTGGYGNSYAVTAGNQAYQNYLNQLNNMVPELYEQALNRYNSEGNDLYNRYNLANDMYNNDYAMYRDKVSDWYNDYNLANDKYNTERNFDYNNYSDMLSYWQSKAGQEQEQYNWQKNYDETVRQYNEDMAYKKARDAVADSQWAQELAYQKARDAVKDSQWAQELELSKTKAAQSASKSSSSSSAKTGKNYTGITKDLENTLSKYTDTEKLEDYIEKAVKKGTITDDEGYELYKKYSQNIQGMAALAHQLQNQNYTYYNHSIFKDLDDYVIKKGALK